MCFFMMYFEGQVLCFCYCLVFFNLVKFINLFWLVLFISRIPFFFILGFAFYLFIFSWCSNPLIMKIVYDVISTKF